MAKNSLDQNVLLSYVGARKLEGTVISRSVSGVNFSYRKPGGSNMITEFFPEGNILAVVGADGKDGTIYVIGNTEIFGTKHRNTLVLTGVTGFSPNLVSGTSDVGPVLINTKYAAFRQEIKSEEGGRGRKPGKAKEEKAEKPAKAAKADKAEKAEKPAKADKAAKSEKPAKSDKAEKPAKAKKSEGDWA